MKITKLVLPVGGLGTRLRPLTYKTPKAFILLKGKPLIYWSLKDLAETDIKDVVVVANMWEKDAFEKNLIETRRMFPGLNIHLRFQEEPFGNGDAILEAGDIIDGYPFIVHLCDEVLVSSSNPPVKTLIRLFDELGSSILVLGRVPKPQVIRYGVVAVEKVDNNSEVYQIKNFIEKPKLDQAPSNLISIFGHALDRSMFSILKELGKTARRVKDGLPITDVFARSLENGDKIYGWEFPGRRFDCGNIEGLKKAEEEL